MNIISAIHVLASLLTVVLAIYTIFQVFHRYSFQHRLNAMTAKMKPMIIGRNTRSHILEVMKLDGFPENEAEELYDILEQEIDARRSQTPKSPKAQQ